MPWRLISAAVLLTLTIGCDRSNGMLATAPTPPGSVTILIVTDGFFLTGFASNTVTVARGSTVTFVNNDTTPHMLPIAGTVKPAFLQPGAQAVITLSDAGTFAFCCALNSNTAVTIVVV